MKKLYLLPLLAVAAIVCFALFKEVSKPSSASTDGSRSTSESSTEIPTASTTTQQQTNSNRSRAVENLTWLYNQTRGKKIDPVAIEDLDGPIHEAIQEGWGGKVRDNLPKLRECWEQTNYPGPARSEKGIQRNEIRIALDVRSDGKTGTVNSAVVDEWPEGMTEAQRKCLLDIFVGFPFEAEAQFDLLVMYPFVWFTGEE